MEASTFSGPTLAPPISDTADTAMVPGTSPVSKRSALRSSNKPGTSSGRRVSRLSRPTTRPAAAVTATHHQCPPNQPGPEPVVHLTPNLMIPSDTSPAKAPNTPSANAQPMSTQNSRFRVTAEATSDRGIASTNMTLATNQ
jgi:hypothetical protein